MTYGPTQTAIEKPADWKARAACAGLPNEAFFPLGEEPDQAAEAHAKQVCSTCPVSVECLTYALETNQRAGVWGGTTEKERKSLRRKWLAERRRSA